MRMLCMCNCVAFMSILQLFWAPSGCPTASVLPQFESRLSHMAPRSERIFRHPAFPLVGAAAIAGLAFVLVSARALPLLGGILATLAIGVCAPLVALAGMTATVAWDRSRCRVGDALGATITRQSILPWWRPQLSVRWPDAAEETTDAAIGGRVAGTVVPLRRGRFPRSAPRLESNQPFGVVTARRAIAMPAPVIVWPARARMRVLAGLDAAAGMGRELSERISGHSGDSIGARDYRPGDSARSIHWAHTARRGELVVRERPGTAAATVRIVLDHRLLGRTSSIGQSAAAVVENRAVDALVGIAFAIIESWGPRGVMFELVWPGRAALIPRSPADITLMLDELACLEPLATGDVEPVTVPRGRPRAVDLEILLTTPSGRDSIAAAVEAATSYPRRERLWIVVGAESPAISPRTGHGRRETVLQVPLEPDPIAAVDALVAAVRHDPDAQCVAAAGTAR